MRLHATKTYIDPEKQYERAARLAMLKFPVKENESDGSQRLLYYGRQCKKFGVIGKRGVELIKEIAFDHPFPKQYTDEQILRRINEANVNEGEARTESWTPPPMPEFIPPTPTQKPIESAESKLTEFVFKCGGIIGDYIEHNLDTAKRPQPIFALAGAIALVSVLVGRKVRDEFGTRPNLQLICVGKTASGKDHARSLNSEILSGTGNGDLLAPDEFTSDTAVYKSLVEHPCRIIHLDEFGRFLQAAQNRNSSHLAGVVTAMMKIYTSAGNPAFKPKSFANKKDNPDMAIAYPHLTLLATSTPEAVYAGIGASMIEDGFLGRCLIFESHDQPRLHMTPEKSFTWSLRGFAEAWRDMPEGEMLRTTDEALAIFVDAENEAHDKLIANGKASGLWGRYSQKARQLAMVEACSRFDDPSAIMIDKESAEWGCNLAKLLTVGMETIADEWLASNLLESHVQKVLRIIKEQPGITKNQLTRRTQWLKQQDRHDIIETLVSSGQVRWEDRKDTTKPVVKLFAV